MMKAPVARIIAAAALLAASLGPCDYFWCQGLSFAPRTKDGAAASRKASSSSSSRTRSNNEFPKNPKSFAVPLTTIRPEPKTAVATWKRLWNDPRPITSLIRDALDNNNNNESEKNGSVRGGGDGNNNVPYCLLSEIFVVDGQHRFQISLFPRGRFAAGSSKDFKANNGPAAAYLKYYPERYGDEVDLRWRLSLVDTRTNTPLPVISSGGLPRSNTTWSAAMTFCADGEDIESCGRAADWGCSSWYQGDVCDAVASSGGVSSIEARVEVTVHGSRTGELSWRLPTPGGALAAAYQSSVDAGQAGKQKSVPEEYGDETANAIANLPPPRRRLEERSFRVGEVIVPMPGHPNEEILEQSCVTTGTDYRIMTMADKDGNPIFSTNDVPSKSDRSRVRLALRPCGWKLQRQVQQQQQQPIVQWPVEVEAGLLSTSAKSRFNLETFFPRAGSTVKRDGIAVVLLGIALALLPVPATLVGRNYVSLYAIPSASMDPTLSKGDVLLVNKLPGTISSMSRGDIVLFRPPSALTDIVGSIDGNSLFVKRVVGLPGDEDIRLNPETKEVTLNGGQRAAGPDRNLCDDEPLRLIDKFLETGKGKQVDRLEDGEVYVVGDCKTVSIDSRVFGVLPAENIEGKPVGRVWPPSRIMFKKL